MVKLYKWQNKTCWNYVLFHSIGQASSWKMKPSFIVDSSKSGKRLKQMTLSLSRPEKKQDISLSEVYNGGVTNTPVLPTDEENDVVPASPEHVLKSSFSKWVIKLCYNILPTHFYIQMERYCMSDRFHLPHDWTYHVIKLYLSSIWLYWLGRQDAGVFLSPSFFLAEAACSLPRWSSTRDPSWNSEPPAKSWKSNLLQVTLISSIDADKKQTSAWRIIYCLDHISLGSCKNKGSFVYKWQAGTTFTLV